MSASAPSYPVTDRVREAMAVSLRGCEELLPKFSHLYIECSFVELYAGQALAPQVIAWLEERGFVLTSIHNLCYGKNGLAVQGDFLFTRRACAS